MRVSVLLNLCLLCVSFFIASLAWTAPTPADQAFIAARQLYRTANDDQAVVELKKFIAAYPKDERVHEATFMLGCSYQRLGQLPLAVTTLNQVVAKATGTEFARLRADAHFQLGDCYLQQSDYQHAAQSFDNALKLVTDDADFIAQARYFRASCLYQTGLGKDALPVFQQVVDVTPEHPLAPWCLYSVGVIQLEAANYPAAITALEATLARYPDSDVAGDAKLKLAAAYLERARAAKDPAAATADRGKAFPLLQAIVDNAKLGDEARMQAANLLARAYLEIDDNEKAIALCAQVLARAADPSSPPALLLRLARADACYNAKRFAEAAADYAAVAGDRNSPQALQSLYWLGNSRYQLGLEKKDKTAFIAAIDSFTAFLQGDGAAKLPNAARAQLLIGMCHEELANLGDEAARLSAVNAFKSVADRWPGSREATEASARIANQTGEMSATELEKLAGTLPAGEPLWNVLLQLGSQHYRAKQYDDTARLAQKVLDGKPAPAIAARAAYLKALALLQAKRGKEAIPYFQQTIAGEAGELALPARHGLIQAYLQAKQYPEAREAAKALLALPNEAKTPAERETELANRLLLLAEAHAGARQLPEADAAYLRAIKECPASDRVPFALMGRAWVAEERKDPAVANAVYAELIARFPKHELVSEANFRLGVNLSALKEYEKAIAALRLVPKTYALADEAAYKIAWAFRDWGKVNEANAQFKLITEDFPKSPFAGAGLFHLGEYAFEQGQYKDAQALLQRALEVMAANYNLRPHAQLKLGACLYEQQDYAGAAATLGTLAADEKAGGLAAEALFWKAKSLEGQGQTAAAREAYGQYVAKNPEGALVLDAQLGAGRAALAAKKTADARADLQKALDLCARLADKDPALAERAKSVGPEAQYLLGQAAMDEKQYDEALTQLALVSAYNIEPWYSRSLLQMARCSALSGNNSAAEKTLALLQKSFPDSEAAKQIPRVVEEFKLKVE